MDSILFKSFVPEIFLSLSILSQLLFNARVVNTFKFNYPLIDKEIYSQTVFVLFCVLLLLFNLKIEGFFSNFLFLNDDGTKYTKIVLIITCLCIINVVSHSFSLQKLNFFEFFTVFLLSVFSLMLVISCYDLLSFYISIEMQSLCFYILACFKRNSVFSTESGLKYFISGSFISGFFLLGASLIYGSLGTLNLNYINQLLSFDLESLSTELRVSILFGILLVTTMLLFKIGCFPFHFWSPDVYEGSPLSSTIIFSLIPKISVLFFFSKWISHIGVFHTEVKLLLLLFGASSALWGTFFALKQKRMKRFIIYSSVAQVGFLVSSISLNTLGGYSAFLFFIFFYLITSFLVWAHIFFHLYFQSLAINTSFVYKSPLFLSSLTNFFFKSPLWAFSLAVVFFSIAGIPPFTGFLSKFFILLELVYSSNIFFATALTLISALSAFYYIRIIKIVFFEPKTSTDIGNTFQIIFYKNSLDSIYLLMSVSVFLLLILFYKPTVLILFCQYISMCSFGF